MKKYKDGFFEFYYETVPYLIDWYGKWLLDGPEGYQRWLEEYLVWNCYDSEDREVEDTKILIEAERQLTIEIASVIV